MKTYKLNIVLLLSILTVVSILGSCRKDKFEDDIIIKNPPPGIDKVLDINGIILDEDSAPLANVIVAFGDHSVNTDEDGYFLLRQSTVKSEGSMVHVSKSGFFDSYRRVYPQATQEKLYIQLELIKKDEITTFNSSVGDVITINGGASVTFLANTIMTLQGGDFQGEVSVAAHWYDPSSLNLGLNSPSNLEGIDKDGELVNLSTFGMIAVELSDNAGNPLQIKSGETASLLFPIPSIERQHL